MFLLTVTCYQCSTFQKNNFEDSYTKAKNNYGQEWSMVINFVPKHSASYQGSGIGENKILSLL
jgi:hypothetical protein